MANEQNLKPFKKGHDERRHMTGEKKLPDLKKVIYERLSNGEEVSDIIDVLIKIAKKGDLKAIDMILDRGYGKATNQIEVSGKDGAPIIVKAIPDNF